MLSEKINALLEQVITVTYWIVCTKIFIASSTKLLDRFFSFFILIMDLSASRQKANSGKLRVFRSILVVERMCRVIFSVFFRMYNLQFEELCIHGLPFGSRL